MRRHLFVDIVHDWIGDLEIDLRHVESDTTQRMFDRDCDIGSYDLLVTFDSDAAIAVIPNVASSRAKVLVNPARPCLAVT